MPHLGDQTLQLQLDPGQLGGREIGVVACRQLLGDGVVFLDQGAPRYLGRVGCQHQLDIQPADLAGEKLVAVAGRLQAFEQIGEDARLERRRLTGCTATDLVILLGDVGQVEKLVERPGHRQQLVLVQAVQRLCQLLRALGRSSPGGLGPLANALDLVEELIAVLGTDGIAEQLAEQMHVVAQARIDDFRHDLCSSRQYGQ